MGTMRVTTKLTRIADQLRAAADQDHGLEIELSKDRVKTVRRIADQLDALVKGQAEDAAAEREAMLAEQERAHQERVDKVLALMSSAGVSMADIRRSGAAPPARRKRGRSSEAAMIREWAVDNGYAVSPLGIIPAKIRAAFEEAHRQ